MQEAKWYDFEEAYRQHGLTPEEKQEIALSQKKKPVQKKSIFSARDKKVILMLVAVIGLAAILSIVSAAYTATLKYQINTLMQENVTLENEIVDTDIKLQTSNSIINLEKRAKKMLGMKYPSSDQIVYVNDIKTPGDLTSVVGEMTNN